MTLPKRPLSDKRFSVKWSDDGLTWASKETDDFLEVWGRPFVSVTRTNLHPTAAYAANHFEMDYRMQIAESVRKMQLETH